MAELPTEWPAPMVRLGIIRNARNQKVWTELSKIGYVAYVQADQVTANYEMDDTRKAAYVDAGRMPKRNSPTSRFNTASDNRKAGKFTGEALLNFDGATANGDASYTAGHAVDGITDGTNVPVSGATYKKGKGAAAVTTTAAAKEPESEPEIPND